jgi:hypothetical protein
VADGEAKIKVDEQTIKASFTASSVPEGAPIGLRAVPEVPGPGKSRRRPVQIDNALHCNTEARRTRIPDM